MTIDIFRHYNIPEHVKPKLKTLLYKHCIYKLIGKIYFWKYIFKTNYSTLNPRADTELILEILHSRYTSNSKHTILELGIGTGAVIISILLDFIYWSGVGIDISHKALRVARHNMSFHTLNRLNIIHNNWLNGMNNTYDILIANPPYLMPCEYNNSHINAKGENVKYFDPKLALVEPSDVLEGNAKGENVKYFDPKLALVEPSDLFFYKEIAKKAHLFKHILMEVSTTRNIEIYIDLFSIYKYEVHYIFITNNNEIKKLPFILEVWPNLS